MSRKRRSNALPWKIASAPAARKAKSTTAVSAGDTYSAVGSQTVNLSATVTSPNGTVNEGTETFTILAGSTPVGSSVTVNVVNKNFLGLLAEYSPEYDCLFKGTANLLPRVKAAKATTHTAAVRVEFRQSS